MVLCREKQKFDKREIINKRIGLLLSFNLGYYRSNSGGWFRTAKEAQKLVILQHLPAWAINLIDSIAEEVELRT